MMLFVTVAMVESTVPVLPVSPAGGAMADGGARARGGREGDEAESASASARAGKGKKSLEVLSG